MTRPRGYMLIAESQRHASANRFSRDRSLLKEEKERLGCHPCDQQDAAGRDSEHYERSEIVILGLPSQRRLSVP